LVSGNCCPVRNARNAWSRIAVSVVGRVIKDKGLRTLKGDKVCEEKPHAADIRLGQL
jgi:hypothetical protein